MRSVPAEKSHFHTSVKVKHHVNPEININRAWPGMMMCSILLRLYVGGTIVLCYHHEKLWWEEAVVRRSWVALRTLTFSDILNNSTTILSFVDWSHACVCGKSSVCSINRNSWKSHFISILFQFIKCIKKMNEWINIRSLCEGSDVPSYWCVASSGRSGCTSGRRTGSCRCWACTLWPPGWACSCAPVHRASRRRKVCPETFPRPHCGTETGVQSPVIWRGWRHSDGGHCRCSYNSLMRMSGTQTLAVGIDNCLTSSKSSGFHTRNSSVQD